MNDRKHYSISATDSIDRYHGLFYVRLRRRSQANSRLFFYARHAASFDLI